MVNTHIWAFMSQTLPQSDSEAPHSRTLHSNANIMLCSVTDPKEHAIECRAIHVPEEVLTL